MVGCTESGVIFTFGLSAASLDKLLCTRLLLLAPICKANLSRSLEEDGFAGLFALVLVGELWALTILDRLMLLHEFSG